MRILFDQFDMLVEASNGIKKLRELILQLAVQGKLVPQDPADEPAAVLLEKIKAEKERLIKEGKLKVEKPLPPISEEEKPYELPKGWEWAYFGTITISRDGERIPLSREQRLTMPGIYDYYGASGVIDKINDFLFDSPLLLIGEDGANLINRSTPIAFIASGKYWVNNHAHVLDGINFDLLQYLCLYINAIDLKPYVTGTAQPKMNQSKMNSIPVALPPINEQMRIVEKVDRLMALCDELEKQEAERNKKQADLNTACLDKLLASSEPGETREQWQRIADHFDVLYNKPGNVEKLKQAILQLTVQGKLVPKDPSDEPAAVLLEKIKAEKERLIKEGKIKAEKPLPPISEEEKPYELPKGWEWVRLSDISLKIGSGSTPRGGKEVYLDSGIPFLRSQNVWDDGLKLENVVYITEEINNKMANTTVIQNDILLNITGASIGRSCVIPINFSIGNVSQHVCIIRLVNTDMVKFVHNFILSPLNQEKIMEVQVGVSREGLSKKQLELFLIPLPPLEEQERIVEKVDRLMALCERLGEELRQAESLREKLFQAVLAKTKPGE